MAAPDPGIDELYDTWREAFARGDDAAVFTLLTPDYTLWPAGGAMVGIDQLRVQLKLAFERYEVDSTFERVECFVSGNLAIDCGWDVQRVRPRDGSPERHQRQRVWVMLRRGNDGRSRFARGIAQAGPQA
jgi:ketosteroid isomerase-like protein